MHSSRSNVRPSSIVLTFTEEERDGYLKRMERLFDLPMLCASCFREGFAFDAGWEWLKAIGFEENVAGKSEERRQKQAAAKKARFLRH